MKLLLPKMLLLVVYYASAQFYPGYPHYYGPYYGLQHFFAPIDSKITPPLNSPFAASALVTDTIKPGTEFEVDTVDKVTKPSCDCDFVSGWRNGCKIVKAAPPGYSCNCQLGSSGLSCSGTAERCIGTDPSCLKPDTSIRSCYYNFFGNCNGYTAPSGCSCKYRSGGCYIASPAPAYYACHCDYVGFWTCSGRTIPNNINCKQIYYNEQRCLHPGTSKADCEVAWAGSIKPDCGGY